jgi:RIO-like serine/threonine protein kinase
MIGNDIGLGKLCEIYNKMNEGEKEKIIKLAEGLLNSQIIINDENSNSIDKKNDELKINSEINIKN